MNMIKYANPTSRHTHTHTYIVGNGRVLSIDPKIYKQSILMLTLHLECFCVHQQRIVPQKDLFQPAEICIWYNGIWYNEAFFIVAPWCQISKYGLAHDHNIIYTNIMLVRHNLFIVYWR
jgi:hypothetical protein